MAFFKTFKRTNRHTIVGTRQDEGNEAIELRLDGKFQVWLGFLNYD